MAPYEKWEYYDPRVKQIEQDRNYALNKTQKVAWFVSNCGARNGRLQYAHELQKYIQVGWIRFRFAADKKKCLPAIALPQYTIVLIALYFSNSIHVTGGYLWLMRYIQMFAQHIA